MKLSDTLRSKILRYGVVRTGNVIYAVCFLSDNKGYEIKKQTIGKQDRTTVERVVY